MQQRLIETGNNDTSPVTLISFVQQVTSGFLQQVTSANPSAESVQSGHSQAIQDPNLQVESLSVDPPEASRVPYTESSDGNTHLDAIAVALPDDSGEGTGSNNDSQPLEALLLFNGLDGSQLGSDQTSVQFDVSNSDIEPNRLESNQLESNQACSPAILICTFVVCVGVFGPCFLLFLNYEIATSAPSPAPTPAPTQVSDLVAQTIWGVEQQNYTGDLYDSFPIPLNNG